MRSYARVRPCGVCVCGVCGVCVCVVCVWRVVCVSCVEGYRPGGAGVEDPGLDLRPKLQRRPVTPHAARGHAAPVHAV
jgi:hypothetical protein